MSAAVGRLGLPLWVRDRRGARRCGFVRIGKTGAALALAVPLLCGCAASAPLPTWQARVGEWIGNDGHGDPNVLLKLPYERAGAGDRPARITVGATDIVVGLGETRDVQGVLLGCRRVAGAGWYVFLVGVVRPVPPDDGAPPGGQAIEDVRLVALQAADGQLDWRVAEPDPAALEQYRRARDRMWMLDRPDSAFPGAGDLFRLEVDGDVVTAREQRSGARWTLRLTR
ncbi:MAG: hypothetical protein AB1601_02310 [Planctomycetota bacterium]